MMVWFMHCTTFIVLVAASSAVTEAATVFVEPLKNITAVAGSSTEISCAVLHLQGAPVAWLHKSSETSVNNIIAVGGHIFTRNPRISSSVSLRPGNVTESTLRLLDIQSADEGIYTCTVAVRDGEGISQSGTLEVTQPVPRDSVAESPSVSPPTNLETPPTTATTHPANDTLLSRIYCFDADKMWNDTKKEAVSLVKNFWEKVSFYINSKFYEIEQ